MPKVIQLGKRRSSAQLTGEQSLVNEANLDGLIQDWLIPSLVDDFLQEIDNKAKKHPTEDNGDLQP